MNIYQTTIEELCFDEEIGLGDVSRSTVYRWTRNINQILIHDQYDCRVKADYKNKSIKRVNMP